MKKANLILFALCLVISLSACTLRIGGPGKLTDAPAADDNPPG